MKMGISGRKHVDREAERCGRNEETARPELGAPNEGTKEEENKRRAHKTGGEGGGSTICAERLRAAERSHGEAHPGERGREKETGVIRIR